jgi:hypothetical protein
MRSEKISFTYILFATGVTSPVAISAWINGLQVACTEIQKGGRFEFVVECELEPGPAELSLKVHDTSKAAVSVTSIKMQWLQENSNINPNWTNREAGPNEIWNYNMPESNPWTAERNASFHGTIMLEYETDRRKSFLRSYAKVAVGDQHFDLRNKTGQYTFKEPGTFTLPMTSPVSYWLMKRLFVEI